MVKLCDKCKEQLEENEGSSVKQQTIELYDDKLDLCNDCSLQVYKFVTGKEPEFMCGSDALFD